jgi:hypothetical protein
MPDTSSVTASSSELVSLLDVLKWPLLVIFFLVIFRKPIIAFINRLTKIGRGNLSLVADGDTHQQKGNPEKPQASVSLVDKGLGLFQSETIGYFHQLVMKETDLSNIAEESSQVERLSNYATILYIYKYFDSIYYVIYGSQLQILQQLNTFAVETRETLKRFYDAAVTQNPAIYANYTYESYLAYLLSYQLILDAGTQIRITYFGADFLKYIVATNKTMNRIG